MKCLRCGYCCVHYVVAIVDDPKKGFDPNDPLCENVIVHNGDGPCQHLTGDKPGEYICTVHDESWYKFTPCAQFGQVEADDDTPCRMGVYQLNKLKENDE